MPPAGERGQAEWKFIELSGMDDSPLQGKRLAPHLQVEIEEPSVAHWHLRMETRRPGIVEGELLFAERYSTANGIRKPGL
jgi:hypothetical protein